MKRAGMAGKLTFGYPCGTRFPLRQVNPGAAFVQAPEEASGWGAPPARTQSGARGEATPAHAGRAAHRCQPCSAALKRDSQAPGTFRPERVSDRALGRTPNTSLLGTAMSASVEERGCLPGVLRGSACQTSITASVNQTVRPPKRCLMYEGPADRSAGPSHRPLRSLTRRC